MDGDRRVCKEEGGTGMYVCIILWFDLAALTPLKWNVEESGESQFRDDETPAGAGAGLSKVAYQTNNGVRAEKYHIVGFRELLYERDLISRIHLHNGPFPNGGAVLLGRGPSLQNLNMLPDYILVSRTSDLHGWETWADVPMQYPIAPHVSGVFHPSKGQDFSIISNGYAWYQYNVYISRFCTWLSWGNRNCLKVSYFKPNWLYGLPMYLWISNFSPT
jgi:hypothetical protein